PPGRCHSVDPGEISGGLPGPAGPDPGDRPDLRLVRSVLDRGHRTEPGRAGTRPTGRSPARKGGQGRGALPLRRPDRTADPHPRDRHPGSRFGSAARRALKEGGGTSTGAGQRASATSTPSRSAGRRRRGATAAGTRKEGRPLGTALLRARDRSQWLSGATPTMGWAGGFAPREPRNGALEKSKIPPSAPTIR